MSQIIHTLGIVIPKIDDTHSSSHTAILGRYTGFCTITEVKQPLALSVIRSVTACKYQELLASICGRCNGQRIEI